MSFGFSPSDVIALINLTAKTYQGWRDACGDYADVTGTLHSLQIILRRVDAHFKTRQEANIASGPSAAERLASEQADLERVVGACNGAVKELDTVVRKYKSLSTSRRRNWDRIRLGNKDLSKLRIRLNQHVTDLSAFLLTVELESIDVIGQNVAALPDVILQGVSVAVGNLIGSHTADNRSARGSVMTNYEDDDKQVWRQFRRELVQSGVKSEDIKKHRHALHDFLASITAPNTATVDEETPHEPALSDLRGDDECVTLPPAPAVISCQTRYQAYIESCSDDDTAEIQCTVSPTAPAVVSPVQARYQASVESCSDDDTAEAMPGPRSETNALRRNGDAATTDHVCKAADAAHVPGRDDGPSSLDNEDAAGQEAMHEHRPWPVDDLTRPESEEIDGRRLLTYEKLPDTGHDEYLYRVSLPRGWKMVIYGDKVGFADKIRGNTNQLFSKLPQRRDLTEKALPHGWSELIEQGRVFWSHESSGLFVMQHPSSHPLLKLDEAGNCQARISNVPVVPLMSVEHLKHGLVRLSELSDVDKYRFRTEERILLPCQLTKAAFWQNEDCAKHRRYGKECFSRLWGCDLGQTWNRNRGDQVITGEIRWSYRLEAANPGFLDHLRAWCVEASAKDVCRCCNCVAQGVCKIYPEEELGTTESVSAYMET